MEKPTEYVQRDFADYLLERSCEETLYYRERYEIVQAFFEWNSIINAPVINLNNQHLVTTNSEAA